MLWPYSVEKVGLLRTHIEPPSPNSKGGELSDGDKSQQWKKLRLRISASINRDAGLEIAQVAGVTPEDQRFNQ